MEVRVNHRKAVLALILAATVSGCTTRAERHGQYVRQTSQVMINEAYRYVREHKYEEALEVYKRAVELDPSNDNIYVYRGSVYLTLNDSDRAITESNKAIELNDRNEFAYVNRAEAFINKKKFEEAIADCNRALEVNPDFYPALGKRGVARYHVGEIKDAIRDLTVSIHKFPAERAAYLYYVRSKCYDSLDKSILATDDLEKSRELGYQPRADRIY